MNVRTILGRLARVIADEAERNPPFQEALEEALVGTRKQAKESPPVPTGGDDAKRGKNRRNAAAIDPVQLVRDGEPALRDALSGLSLNQLRDIVAEYGMDPSRLVMKWATPDRVIERIVEMALVRAQKGNAFRKPVETALPSAAETIEAPPPGPSYQVQPPKPD